MLTKMLSGDKRPIGIFDSGVGGLSILRELRKQAPTENIVYFADSRYFPYGTRSVPEIRKRAFAVTQHLLKSDAKLIIVACNTASSAALDDLRNVFDVPFIGIVPPIKPSVTKSLSKKIAILATSGTLQGDLYRDVVAKNGSDVVISNIVSEELITLVETGNLQSPLLSQTIQKVLGKEISNGVDTVVLGCTHYELISEAIETKFPNINVFGASAAVARQTCAVIKERQCGKLDDQVGKVRIFTSHDQNHFMAVMLKLGFAESYD